MRCLYQDYDEFDVEPQGDGSVIYRHPGGSQIDTYSLSLEEFLGSLVRKFKALVDMIDDEEYSNFGYLAEAVMRDFTIQADEALTAIADNIGDISFDLVSRNRWPYRGGKVLNAFLSPAQEKAPEASPESNTSEA